MLFLEFFLNFAAQFRRSNGVEKTCQEENGKLETVQILDTVEQ